MSRTAFACGGLALALLLGGRPARAQGAKAPAVLLKPTHREGDAASTREGSALTGGGAVVATQPAPDTLVFTLTGVAAAKANPCKPSFAALESHVAQQFEVVFPAGLRPARLILEARVIGLLRSEGCKSGSAELVHATAAVQHGEVALATISLGPKGVACRDGLSINLAEGPVCAPVGPGCHSLNLGFRISASQVKCFCPYISSAEFAPPPALPAAWVHEPDPFGGMDRSQLGFQVVVRVEPAPGAEAEKVPAPVEKLPAPAVTTPRKGG
jgi:hypothetical protein